MKKICVYCGSSMGTDPQFARSAVALGQELLRRETGLVYGGGYVGLMGEVARTVAEGGGYVAGVIPESIYRMVEHIELSELFVVNDMHERKAKMAELSDGFICLPGGIGTMEEFFEMFTWGQLGFHSKPVALLNTGGYFDKLTGFLDYMVQAGFLKQPHRDTLIVDTDPAVLIDKMYAFRPVNIGKWWKEK